MRNTLAVIEHEFRRRGLRPEQYWAAASVIVAKEISGMRLATSEPGFLGRLAEGESGEFINNVVVELFQRVPDLHGPVLAYQINAPDGSVVKVRGGWLASSFAGVLISWRYLALVSPAQ